MYRFFIILTALILGFIPIKLAFAEGCDIPDELPSNSELSGKIDQCIEARSGKWESPNSITEFVCPQGAMWASNNQSITNETLAYNIAVNLAFNKADKDIKKYMQELQKNREPDPTKWMENIRSCTDKIASIYDKICSFWSLEKVLNENKDKIYIQTTNTYPQELCRVLAKKKKEGWYNLGTIMMSDGIAKNKKNSTDTWVTEIKWVYAKVLADFHDYQKILARAAGKMTGYNKQIVK